MNAMKSIFALFIFILSLNRPQAQTFFCFESSLLKNDSLGRHLCISHSIKLTKKKDYLSFLTSPEIRIGDGVGSIGINVGTYFKIEENLRLWSVGGKFLPLTRISPKNWYLLSGIDYELPSGFIIRGFIRFEDDEQKNSRFHPLIRIRKNYGVGLFLPF